MTTHRLDTKLRGIEITIYELKPIQKDADLLYRLLSQARAINRNTPRRKWSEEFSARVDVAIEQPLGEVLFSGLTDDNGFVEFEGEDEVKVRIIAKIPVDDPNADVN